MQNVMSVTGNQNARKWTAETVLSVLDKFTARMCTKKYIYIGTLLLEEPGMYREIWSAWKKDFADNETVCQTIKTIETEIESNLFEGAARSNLNPAVAIFALKNNHKWVDKTEVAHEVKGFELTVTTVAVKNEA
jgi:hypothetical protein